LGFAAENNLSGLEWAGGLPGTLGGAIRGNAGAFKGEIKDNLLNVKSLRLEDGEFVERSNAECEFGYRTSVFKKKRGEIIFEATFKMSPGVKEGILSVAKEKIEYRKSKQPLEYPNIGSIFKNIPLEKFKNGLTEELKTHIKNDPVPLIPAAVLISQTGLKGEQIGGAQVSEKHANFIVNAGGAKAVDVKNLIDLVRDKVKQKFGVELETEVESVGDFD
jgi:UDP-N-acetylmuramate dehydrogenase